jgi:HTH-type transcriptional regulator/antitoxin HipB
MESVSVQLMGEAVRYHRRRAGLSQRGLADLAGVGKTSVFDIEKGKPTVRLATLVAVLRVLNIDLAMDGPLMSEFVSTRSKREDGAP